MDESLPLWPLCNSHDLLERGLAVPFDVNYAGQTCRAFAIRFNGLPHAYLNRCTHVAMELDWQPNQIFDASGQWLVCASHGAAYQPGTGAMRWRALPRRTGQDHAFRKRRGRVLAFCLQPHANPVLILP